jgi:hypothetical protein
MSFIAAHPLLLVLGLLTVAFITLWTTSEDFRRIVIGVFNAVAGFITDKVGGAFRWVIDRGIDLVNWFIGLPGMLGRALGGLGEALGGAFKFALNLVIDYTNWWIRRLNDLIHGVNVVNPFSDIPSIPQIARLHGGGEVPGNPWEERLAILQPGEIVNERGSGGGGGGTWRVVGSGALFEAINAGIRDGDIVLEGRA